MDLNGRGMKSLLIYLKRSNGPRNSIIAPRCLPGLYGTSWTVTEIHLSKCNGKLISQNWAFSFFRLWHLWFFLQEWWVYGPRVISSCLVPLCTSLLSLAYRLYGKKSPRRNWTVRKSTIVHSSCCTFLVLFWAFMVLFRLVFLPSKPMFSV